MHGRKLGGKHCVHDKRFDAEVLSPPTRHAVDALPLIVNGAEPFRAPDFRDMQCSPCSVHCPARLILPSKIPACRPIRRRPTSAIVAVRHAIAIASCSRAPVCTVVALAAAIVAAGVSKCVCRCAIALTSSKKGWGSGLQFR